MLVEGSEGILQASDDVGRMLFQSAAGIEHLGQALKELEAEADQLWGTRKSASRVFHQAQADFDAARRELNQAQLRAREWKEKHDALADTDRALNEASQQLTDIQQQKSRLERIRRVRPLLLALDAALSEQRQLTIAGLPVLLPENAARIHQQASQQSVLALADSQRLSASLSALAQKLEGIVIDREVLGLAAEITALNDERLRFHDHPAQLQKHQTALRERWISASKLAQELGWSGDEESALTRQLPPAALREQIRTLIRQHPGIRQERESTKQKLASLKQQISQWQQQIQALQARNLDNRLPALLDQARKLGDSDKTLSDFRAQIASLDQSIDQARAQMGQWQHPVESLQAMLVPELAQVQRLIDQQHEDEGRLRAAEKNLTDRSRDMQQREQALQQLVRHHQPVSREQLLQARTTRDQQWQRIKADPATLPAEAPGLESRIREADELADARLERAQHEAQRQADADQLDRLRLEAAAIQTEIETIRHQISQRQQDWEAQATACGLPLLPLAMAPAWLRLREQALAAHQQKIQATLACNHHQARVEHIRQMLIEHLHAGSSIAGDSCTRADSGTDGDSSTGAGSNTGGGPSIGAGTGADTGAGTGTITITSSSSTLEEAILLASERTAEANRIRGQIDTLSRQVDEASQQLPLAQSAHQAAEQQWQRWQEGWLDRLKQMNQADDTPVERIETQLGLMQALDTTLEEMAVIRRERIAPLQADLDGWEADARMLAARLMPDGPPASATDVALALHQRLEAARQQEAEAARLGQQQQEQQQALDQAQRKQQEIEATLQPLMEQAGTTDMQALAQAIERSGQRHQVEQKITQHQQQLMQAADGLSIDQLREEAADIDPDQLHARLDSLDHESSQLVTMIRQLSTQQGQQKSDFDALNGHDLAARAAGRQQEAVTRMADAAERYLRLKTAARLLAWSIEKFRETRQGPMLAKASALFSELTLGRFSRLVVDTDEQDKPRLQGIRDNGQPVDVSGLSEGTRDQLYLALRLAALECQSGDGRRLPLIADDLFINFDDERTCAGLRVLAQVSRNRQIIFLTHHAHLVPLARQVLGEQLDVIEL